MNSSPPPEGPSRLGLVRGLGMIGAIALVTGNIIGSGIYVIPASLAQVAGPVSLFAWVIVAIAYLSLTAVYSDLVRAMPLSGGLQVYAQRAFGDLAGFVTAFVYWLSCVIGNAAFLTAFVGYFQVGVPVFARPLPAFLLAQALLWTLTLINIAGVRAGGIVQIVTTVIKLLPLVVLSVVLIPSGASSNLVPFAPHGLMALFPAISLVAWLFLGAESATVPAEEVKGAGVTIGRAAYIGYALAAVVYLVVGFAMTYALPASAIENSPSPLADAARLFLGPAGTVFVTLGALVSIAGILNGWILVAGRLPFAAARQGFGPAFLGRVNPRTGTPVPAILLSSAISSALVTLYFIPSETLLEAYNFVALAATATALVAIGAACLAEIVLVFREPALFTAAQRRRGPVTAAIGFAAVLLMIYGTGGWVWFWTLCTVVLAVPLFFVQRAASGRKPGALAS